MIYIAHRGLFNGPDKLLENNPSQIEVALLNGFDAEVDVWKVGETLWLGHDEPQYQIEQDFLYSTGLWIHAKNLEALDWLHNTNLNYFWHETDKFTLTSHRWIWTYPGNELTNKSILVMPELVDPSLKNAKQSDCYGICSDYVSLFLSDNKLNS